MASTKILIPDMGDFKDVEIIEVLVKEGQQKKKMTLLLHWKVTNQVLRCPPLMKGLLKK